MSRILKGVAECIAFTAFSNGVALRARECEATLSRSPHQERLCCASGLSPAISILRAYGRAGAP